MQLILQLEKQMHKIVLKEALGSSSRFLPKSITGKLGSTEFVFCRQLPLSKSWDSVVWGCSCFECIGWLSSVQGRLFLLDNQVIQ